jgi:hypothetical protein
MREFGVLVVLLGLAACTAAERTGGGYASGPASAGAVNPETGANSGSSTNGNSGTR